MGLNEPAHWSGFTNVVGLLWTDHPDSSSSRQYVSNAQVLPFDHFRRGGPRFVSIFKLPSRFNDQNAL